MSMAAPTGPRSGFSQVIVASGHMVDRPDRAVTRFPAQAERDVADAVRTALRDWDVGPGTLVISGGARGADIIVAEAAIDLGATVWLLLALPDDEFLESSVRLAGTDWEERFLALRRRCPTWTQAEVLGPQPNGGGLAGVFARNNAWCLEAGLAQGPPGEVRAVAVWDGGPGDGQGGTGDFVARARELDVEVKVIRPQSA
ncbi:MAG: hypothetical protein ACRD0A_03810 [Acidimicrobiales bacterium]